MANEFEHTGAEPREVVGCYVPREPQEVKDCYVQPCQLPHSPTPTPAAPVKKRRRNLVIFLIILGVVVLVAVAAAVITALTGKGSTDGTDDNHDASSIVDISGSDVPAIPRADTDPTLRFSCINVWGEEPLTAQDIYAAVNPSVVLVVAEKKDGRASIGTGILLTEDGYFVTNAHVIAGGDTAWIALDTGATYQAELVGFDSGQDIAVLKALGAEGLTPATLADSDWCLVGDTVYAIGNPLGIELRGTLTDGIISAINRQVTMEGRVMTLLQTTAALNNGNSGGPLINDCGQIIGINTLKMSGGAAATATVEGLGFAVPTTRAVSVINDIVATGAFHGFPTLGLYVYSEEQSDGTWQLFIQSATEDFGAAEAGLQKGDRLVAADGEPLATSDDLLAVRQGHIVGETMRLTVEREGETFDVDVMLYAQDEM